MPGAVYGRRVSTVDIRSGAERRGGSYVPVRNVYLIATNPPAGFQTCAEVYGSYVGAAWGRVNGAGTAPGGTRAGGFWGWVAQRDASNTRSGYAGWYTLRDGSGEALNTRGTRYHSRRLALGSLYDVFAARPGNTGTGATMTPPAGTVTGATDLRCDTCGHTFPASENPARGFRRGVTNLCPSCVTRDLHRVIGYHGWNPAAGPWFGTGAGTTDPDTFGWELEAHNDRRVHGNDEVAARVADVFPAGVLYAEEDCSIGGGFESITAPMTRDYYKTLVADGLVDRYLRTFRESGFVSHEADMCGLHVHVARTALGTCVTERDDTVLKLLAITENRWADLVRLARRTDYQLRSYARSYASGVGGGTPLGVTDLERYTRNDGAGAKSAGLRMFALNLTNEHTVEFRMARGTVKTSTFLAWIDLVWALVDVARTKTFRTIDAAGSLRELLDGFVTPDLDAYMTSKGM